MNRKYRLTNSKDFKRVRQQGNSYAHPFVVLIVLSSTSEFSRIGITATRAIGNAVQRNRAKRKLRAIINPIIPQLSKRADLIIIARPKLLKATHQELKQAVSSLINKAGLLEKSKNE